MPRKNLNKMTPQFVMPIILFTVLVIKQASSTDIDVTSCPEMDNRRWVTRIISEYIWDLEVTSDTNPECSRHFEIYRQHQKNFTAWALQMFDSSDVIPKGFLVGDIYNLGNFEECIETQVPEEFGFSAQYCLPTFHLNLSDTTLKSSERLDEWKEPIWKRIKESKNSRVKVPKDRFYLAFCVPSTCSSGDLQTSLQKLLEEPMKREAYDLSISLDHLACSIKDEPPKPLGYRVMRYFLSGMTAIILFCTALDILLAAILREKYDIMNCSFEKVTGVEKWILPFSIFRNVRRLWAPPTSPYDYKILHGMKAVLHMASTLGHRALLPMTYHNWIYIENEANNFRMIPYGILFIPDVFLCVSGFLLTLSMLRLLERNTFSAWTHVINRLIASLPPYLFVIAFFIFMVPYLDNGPMWKATIEPEVDYCRRGWWTNILFINNYIGGGQWCLPHSWYAAADMHFFIVGSAIVYTCWRWKSLKVVVLTIALSLSILIPFTNVYRYDYDGLMKTYYDFIAKPRENEWLLHFYMKSHNRFGGYITGICSAFFMNHLKERGYKFSKIASWAGILTSLSIILAVVIVRASLHISTARYNVLVRALFAGFSPQLSCVCIMIIVIIQITSDFGALNSLFFTQNLFVPLSRLSYWIFLINMPLIMFQDGSLMTTVHLTTEKLLYGGHYWGIVVLTMFLALYCYLIIDAPINHVKPRIIKYVSSRLQPTSSKKDQ